MIWLRNRYTQWLISGLLLGLGFLSPLWWILSVVGATYFIYLLEQSGTISQKARGSFLAWTIKMALVLGWFWSTYPIEWLPVEFSNIQIILIGFPWVVTVLTMASGSGALLVAVWLKEHFSFPRWSYLFLIYPSFWVIGESLGSLIFSIVSYGPGGSVNHWFSFGYAGYVLTNHDWLLSLASLTGVYGLSFFLIMLAGLLVWLVERLRRGLFIGVGVIGLLYLTSFLPVNTVVAEATSGYKVLTIDTQFNAKLYRSEVGRRQVTKELEAAVQAALAEQPDYIILPEDSRYFNQHVSFGTAKSLFKLRQGNPAVVIVDSGETKINNKMVLQAFVYNGPKGTVDRFHKRYLVPQGEFMPTLYKKILLLLGYDLPLSYITREVSYEVGPWTSQSGAEENVPGVLFCFESFAPQGVKTLVKERPNMPFVAHIASHAWFHEPQTLWVEMEQMLKVQAVWNRQYIVEAGNMVAGKVYTPQGAVIDPMVIKRGKNWQVKEITIPRRTAR